MRSVYDVESYDTLVDVYNTFLRDVDYNYRCKCSLYSHVLAEVMRRANEELGNPTDVWEIIPLLLADAS